MSIDINLLRLGAMLHKKRFDLRLGLRAVAAQCGLSPSTLSRIENGARGMPEVETMTKLAAWLDVPVGALLSSDNAEFDELKGLYTPDAIAILLQSDKRLSPPAAKAIGELVQVVYAQLVTAERTP